MRVRSFILAAAVLAAMPTALFAQSDTPADAEPAATTQPTTLCQASAEPAPAPRRRRGLGGLLRAVGSSGALGFVPGLGMAGQIASLAAGTAAQVSAESGRRQLTADAAPPSDAAMQLAACQAEAAAAADAPVTTAAR